MQISNHYVVCLELTMLEVNEVSIYKKQKTMTYFKKNKAKRPAVRSLPPGPWTQARADEAQRREAFPS